MWIPSPTREKGAEEEDGKKRGPARFSGIHLFLLISACLRPFFLRHRRKGPLFFARNEAKTCGFFKNAL